MRCPLCSSAPSLPPRGACTHALSPSAPLAPAPSTQTPVRDDLEEFFTAWSNPYEPATNPEGYLVLLVAENKLSWDMLRRRLDAAAAEGKQLPAWVAGYNDFRGEERFRAALARMMETTFVHAPVDKDCVLVQAGCSAILDSLAWCVCACARV